MDFTPVNHNGALVFCILMWEIVKSLENPYWILPVSDLRSVEWTSCRVNKKNMKNKNNHVTHTCFLMLRNNW
jgi:hypothetical protein